LIETINNIKDPTLRERIDGLLIKGIITAKLKLGMSIDVSQLANELHREYRRPPVYLKVKIFAKNDIHAVDLAEMPPDKQGRLGTFKFILVILDGYTRYLWTVPLKNKSAITVKDAFERVYKVAGIHPKKNME